MTSVITFQKFENLEENQNISNNVYWWLQNLDADLDLSMKNLIYMKFRDYKL